jgi:hypothetical protein
MKTKLLGMYVGPPTQSMGYGPRQLSMVVPQSQYKNYGNMERGIEQISRNPFLLTPSSWAMKISQSQKKTPPSSIVPSSTILLPLEPNCP